MIALAHSRSLPPHLPPGTLGGGVVRVKPMRRALRSPPWSALNAKVRGSALRRSVVVSGAAATLLFALPNVPSPQPALRPPAAAAAQFPASQALLALIPSMAYGAPATNATLPAALAASIEAAASKLEATAARRPLDTAALRTLDGSWRLLYSNGREITNLAAGLPLGFVLGPTYQPLDLATGHFENQGTIVHKLGIARASTCVVGDVRLAPLGTRNAAGTLNAAGNRVDVDFRRISYLIYDDVRMYVCVWHRRRHRADRRRPRRDARLTSPHVTSSLCTTLPQTDHLRPGRAARPPRGAAQGARPSHTPARPPVQPVQPSTALRKVLVPKRDAAAPQPAIDITYLEAGMRVTRGGDASLFIVAPCGLM